MDEMITVAGVLPTTYLFIISVRREPSPCRHQTPDCPGPGADKVHSCRETVDRSIHGRGVKTESVILEWRMGWTMNYYNELPMTVFK